MEFTTTRPLPAILTRALVVWLILICVEVLHGIARAVLLVPHVGEFRSNQIGVFTGSIIILVTFGFVLVQAFRRKVPWWMAAPFAINLVANIIFAPIQFGLRNLPLARTIAVGRGWQAGKGPGRLAAGRRLGGD